MVEPIGIRVEMIPCKRCQNKFSPTHGGRKLCDLCSNASYIQARRSLIRQQKVLPQKHTLDTSYIIVRDPGDDYSVGAVIERLQISHTLKAKGLNVGTVVSHRKEFYEVAMTSAGELYLRQHGGRS